jgi:hypothetical protein
MGKNNINGKTFLEKRYSEDLELEVRPAFNVSVNLAFEDMHGQF